MPFGKSESLNIPLGYHLWELLAESMEHARRVLANHLQESEGSRGHLMKRPWEVLAETMGHSTSHTNGSWGLLAEAMGTFLEDARGLFL